MDWDGRGEMTPPAGSVIAFDLDGTVYRQHTQEMSPRVMRAFAAACDAGFALSVATGRHVTQLGEDLAGAPWLDWAICSNGAGVYRMADRHPIIERLMPRDLVMEVVRLVGDLPRTWWAMTRESFYIGGPDLKPNGTWWRPINSYQVDDVFAVPGSDQGYLKLMARCHSEEERLEAERRLAPLAGDIAAVNEGPTSLEITASGVSKGSAAVALCERLGIDPARSIAFGDSGNDLSFADTPLTFVVMASAEQKVLDAADEVCPDIDHDGVAAWLEERVLAPVR